jgi:AraC-like DNA-binding protein
MRYFYRATPQELRPYIGSFYLIDTPHDQAGQVRVEIPHLRFICSGTSTLSIADDVQVFSARSGIVCGPSFRTGMAEVSANSLILGCSLTPAGWHALIGQSAELFANRKVDLAETRPDLPIDALFDRLAGTADEAAQFGAIERFLIDALMPDPPPRWDFITPAMAWATDPACPGLDDLVARTGLSSRQVDRLCRTYFGGSPKQVHRVFRALNIAYRLTVDGADDWREVVEPFYDQSHFIKDFKSRIGCTPREFTGERLKMMRYDLAEKAKVADAPKYCVIG